MAKSSKSSGTKSSTKSSSKKTTTTKVNSPNPGRPKPMTTTAGPTTNRRKYEKGGRWCW